LRRESVPILVVPSSRGSVGVSAFVTPGNLRSALAVTRSLGRRGIPVTVADEDDKSLAGVSRYCRESLRVPSPAQRGEAFVSAVRQEVGRGKHRVVIPADDVTLSLLTHARSQFEGVTALPFPDFETVQMAHDKGALMTRAAEHGIPVPKTFIVRSAADVKEAIGHVGLPAVVKARVSRISVEGRWRAGSPVQYVSTAAELDTAIREAWEIAPEPLVQERIPGDGRGIFVLMN